MIGLTSIEINDSICNITAENNKFELFTDLIDDDGFSYAQLKHSFAELLGLSKISSDDLQHQTQGLNLNKTYRKIAIEKRRIDGYYVLLLDNAESPFRDFESYLRSLAGLDESDVQLFSKQYHCYFISHEIPPGIYTNNDFSDFPSRGFQNEFGIRGRIEPNVKYDQSDSTVP